jgi:hypothetical protein
MSSQAVPSRSGWVTFAAILMFAVGGLRIISAISYFADSRRVNDLTLGLFGHNLWAWGLVDLIIGVLAILAGFSLLEGHAYGRIFTYVWAVFVIIDSFLIIGYAPWYGFATMAIAILATYGLATSSNPDAWKD